MYLHKSLCSREPSRPEGVHSEDMFQRTLGPLRSKKRLYVGNGIVDLYANKPVSSLPHKVEPTKQTLSSALPYLAKLL